PACYSLAVRRMLPLTQKLPRRLLALLLALSLFAPASSLGRGLFSCAMSGTLGRGGGRCPRAQPPGAAPAARRASAPAPPPGPAAGARAGHHRRGPAPSLLDEAGGKVPAAALVALLPFEPSPGSVAVATRHDARQSRGPPRGDPIFAQNCRWLI